MIDPIPAAMHWISVKDRLPPAGDEILFVWADSEPEVAKFDGDDWWTHNAANWSEDVYGEVTHWCRPVRPVDT